MATPEEFAEFVAARYPALVRTARFLVADAGSAEDLVQEALVKCVGAWPRIKGDPEAYVRTVMVRTNISRWRRVRVQEHAVEHLPELSVHDPDFAESDALREALAQLPAKQRVVVVLRHVEDRSEREVAEIMGCSLGTVKSQCHAGLAKLRVLMAEGSAPVVGVVAVSR